jgi:hypothetical protein
MLNASEPEAPPAGVIDYQDPVVAHHMANGAMNTSDDQILANISSSIRRGHPQIKTHKNNGLRVCLVGSGPSLNSTLDELRTLVWEGGPEVALVTLNGAYHWCIEHGLKPTTQIVMDARPSNARFVQPEVPHCHYVLASQCAPELWDAASGYKNVHIFHPVTAKDGPVGALLDRYYGEQWIGIGGGTTVASRALTLLRITGHLRFHLFGIDCCWLGDAHHALDQPENNGDIRSRSKVTVGVRGSGETRTFSASGWHLKQLEDFCSILRSNGRHFQIEVHGDGMLAHVMRVLGSAQLDDLTFTQETT